MLRCKVWSLPFLGLRPHPLHPGAIQEKERIKFCHLATLADITAFNLTFSPLPSSCKSHSTAAAPICPPNEFEDGHSLKDSCTSMESHDGVRWKNFSILRYNLLNYQKNAFLKHFFASRIFPKLAPGFERSPSCRASLSVSSGSFHQRIRRRSLDLLPYPKSN